MHNSSLVLDRLCQKEVTVSINRKETGEGRALRSLAVHRASALELWDREKHDEQVFCDKVFTPSPPISHQNIGNFSEDCRNKKGGEESNSVTSQVWHCIK